MSAKTVSRWVLPATASIMVVATALPVAAIDLAPHRAVYDVTLAEASDRSGIDGMRGRIAYEFRGSACDGYTTNFRFVTELSARGDARVTDQQTATFEAGDGSMFRFVTRVFVDQREDTHVEGTAERRDDGLVVMRSEPAEDEVELAPAVFPTAHLIDLLTRAEAGERFYEQPIFDGSDEADRIMTTTVIISDPRDPEAEDDDALAPIADDSYRNVSIAYFDLEGTGDGLPEYRIAFKMHENGITRSLQMDYGEFVLEGTMEELELFEVEDCG